MSGSEKQWTGRKPVIGLLGGPGSGKSFVAGLFTELGCAVIDADAIARDALTRPDVIDTLVSWWGEGIRDPEGGIDRSQVGQIVFEDPAELRRLEGLVHPIVGDRRAELRRRYQADPEVRAIVEDVPLLLEKGLEGVCDVLVFVEASRETRLERVRAHRGWDDAELARRESRQMPLDTKRNRANYVLNNDGDPARTASEARRILSLIFHN
ncbi:MAG: dephospho-CoA kinase [Phycisphaeraceae bacterium]